MTDDLGRVASQPGSQGFAPQPATPSSPDGADPSRAQAWVTRREKYGPRGHGSTYRRNGRGADTAGLLALAIRLHVDGTLSEGQVASASGLDRVDIRQRADECRDARETQRLANRHAFSPHRKYPWFCGQCGYGPSEVLMHLPCDRDASLAEDAQRLSPEGVAARAEGIAR